MDGKKVLEQMKETVSHTLEKVVHTQVGEKLSTKAVHAMEMIAELAPTPVANAAKAVSEAVSEAKDHRAHPEATQAAATDVLPQSLKPAPKRVERVVKINKPSRAARSHSAPSFKVKRGQKHR